MKTATACLIFSLSLSLSLSLSVNKGYAQTPIYNQVGDWCDVYTVQSPGPGSEECDECLNHPQQLMQNASTAKTKNRVLYVDDFALFKQNSKGISYTSGYDDYYFPSNSSILGNLVSEKKLLDYACAAGFDELVLYSVPSVIDRGADYFKGNPSNLTWAEELGRFMLIAHQLYGLEISINAPEGNNTFSNINDLYDITALGNNRMSYLEAFQKSGMTNCINWIIEPGGSLTGGYFELGDINLAYPLDDEGNAHPFDLAALDILNIGRFKYNFERGMSEGFWWQRIYNKMELEDNPWKNEDGSFSSCINGVESNVFLYSELCHSYERIVTEYEFWKDQSTSIYSDATDEVFDIQAGFTEQYILLDYIHCINENLSSHWANIGTECPVSADAYIIQIASASRFADGSLDASPRKHYVNSSTWQTPYNTITTYDYDAASRAMAKRIDQSADRIYLATYRKTPCHLWSDDVVNNNQSYGRRFKDVYYYFSDNTKGALNEQTEIYPLFSARHYVFDHDFTINIEQTYRRHLGLYLSNSGVYAGINGFTGSLGGAENIFTWFAQNPLTGCTSGDLNPNTLYPNPDGVINAPSNVLTSSTINMYTGSVVEITNMVAGNVYTISTGNSTDQFTIREGSITGEVVAYIKGGTVSFKPRSNGTFYVQLNRELQSIGACSYHDPNSANYTSYIRNFTIELEPIGVFETVDANPYTVSHYDNHINGYAWYRYSELSGNWHSNQNSWILYKTSNTTTVVEELIDDDNVTIYPIPATDKITVEQEGNFEIYVFDLSGKQIVHKNGKDLLELTELNKGQYILQVKTVEGIKAQKIVVL